MFDRTQRILLTIIIDISQGLLWGIIVIHFVTCTSLYCRNELCYWTRVGTGRLWL